MPNPGQSLAALRWGKRLTAKQTMAQVARLISAGHNRQWIADQLGVNLATVARYATGKLCGPPRLKTLCAPDSKVLSGQVFDPPDLGVIVQVKEDPNPEADMQTTPTRFKLDDRLKVHAIKAPVRSTRVLRADIETYLMNIRHPPVQYGLPGTEWSVGYNDFVRHANAVYLAKTYLWITHDNDMRGNDCATHCCTIEIDSLKTLPTRAEWADFLQDMIRVEAQELIEDEYYTTVETQAWHHAWHTDISGAFELALHTFLCDNAPRLAESLNTMPEAELGAVALDNNSPDVHYLYDEELQDIFHCACDIAEMYPEPNDTDGCFIIDCDALLSKAQRPLPPNRGAAAEQLREKIYMLDIVPIDNEPRLVINIREIDHLTLFGPMHMVHVHKILL